MDDFQITVIDKNEPDSKLFEIVEYKDRLWRMAKEAKQNKQISKYRDLVQMAFNIDNELNITKNLEDNQGRLKNLEKQLIMGTHKLFGNHKVVHTVKF